MKFKKEFDLENKFDLFIFGLIEAAEMGDWNDYEDGEEVEYDFDLREEEWMDLDFSIDSLEEYIGEGIKYNNCNVVMDDYNIIASYIYKEEGN